MSKLLIGVCLIAAFVLGMAFATWQAPVSEGQAVPLSIRPAVVTPPAVANTGGSAQHDYYQTNAKPLTLGELVDIDSDFEQTVALYNLLADKTPSQLVELIEDTGRHFTGSDYRAATSVMFARLAELDPQRALKVAIESKSTSAQAWISSIFHAMARLDFAKAVAEASQLPGNLRRIAGRAILVSGVQLTLADKRLIKSELGVDAPTILSGRDPVVVWRETLAIANKNKRLQALGGLMQSISAADPALALELVQDLDNAQYRQAFTQQALANWGAADGEAALQWLLNSAQREDQNLLVSLFQGYASSDVSNAISAAESLSGDSFDKVMSAILPNWIQQDAQEASRWLESNTELLANLENGNTLFYALATAAPEEAFSWLERLPKDQARNASRAVVAVTAQSNPKEVARRIEGLTDVELQKSMATQLTSEWASNDPAAAQAWVEELRFDNKTNLYQSLTQAWVRADAKEALTFASDVRDSQNRDAALQGMIFGAFSQTGTHLDDMIAAFERLESDDIRARNSLRVLSSIAQHDGERAERFAKRHDIDISALRGRR